MYLDISSPPQGASVVRPSDQTKFQNEFFSSRLLLISDHISTPLLISFTLPLYYESGDFIS